MTDLFDLARPYLWLAVVAFAVGFFSYMVMLGPRPTAEPSGPHQAPVSAPVADDWNLPKSI